MTSFVPSVLTINGGSSSIRFAVYEAGETLRRQLDGKVDRIGCAARISSSTMRPENRSRPPSALPPPITEPRSGLFWTG